MTLANSEKFLEESIVRKLFYEIEVEKNKEWSMIIKYLNKHVLRYVQFKLFVLNDQMYNIFSKLN